MIPDVLWVLYWLLGTVLGVWLLGEMEGTNWVRRVLLIVCACPLLPAMLISAALFMWFYFGLYLLLVVVFLVTCLVILAGSVASSVAGNTLYLLTGGAMGFRGWRNWCPKWLEKWGDLLLLFVKKLEGGR